MKFIFYEFKLSIFFSTVGYSMNVAWSTGVTSNLWPCECCCFLFICTVYTFNLFKHDILCCFFVVFHLPATFVNTIFIYPPCYILILHIIFIFYYLHCCPDSNIKYNANVSYARIIHNTHMHDTYLECAMCNVHVKAYIFYQTWMENTENVILNQILHSVPPLKTINLILMQKDFVQR